MTLKNESVMAKRTMKSSDVELPSNRKFGFFFAAVFTIIGAFLFTGGQAVFSYVLFALAALFLVITVIKAGLLLPLNKLWMYLGLLLGMIVKPIVLGVIFFGLFTPISLLMKLFGRDELRLKLITRESYWKERNTDAAQADAFKRQF